MSYHMSQLQYQCTGRGIPLQKLSGVAMVSLQECGFSRLQPYTGQPALQSHRPKLGPVQTPYFTWAESNANEREQRILLICIRFGSCEVRRLNLALGCTFWMNASNAVLFDVTLYNSDNPTDQYCAISSKAGSFYVMLNCLPRLCVPLHVTCSVIPSYPVTTT